MDPEFLKILVCPKSRQPLREATAEELEQVNQGIRQGRAQNDAGEKVEEPLESGLIQEEGSVIYRVRDGIPVLLTSEAIPLTQTDQPGQA